MPFNRIQISGYIIQWEVCTLKVAGIIAEYNPFHNGHLYQIKKARELTGADRVVIVMSGDFVQRGSAAITDKYVRTRMALEGGADLVLELPVVASTGSAEYFAGGAVRILNALGCVDCLSFGCENPDMEQLLYLADFFDEEPSEYQSFLQRHMQEGMTFPAAREQALRDFIAQRAAAAQTSGRDPEDDDLIPIDPEDTPSLLRSPNNILAVEYLRALRRCSSSIEPVAIERTDSGFRSVTPDSASGLSSANALRHLIRNRSQSWQTEVIPYIPESSRRAMPSDLWERDSLERRHYDFLLHYRLLSECSLSRYLDVSMELEKRIQSLLPMYRTSDRFLDLLKTRPFTESRCRRALLHIALGITKEDAETFRQESTAPYARILGFRKESADLLHEIKQNNRGITLISKVADAGQILSRTQKRLFDKDLYTSSLYELMAAPQDEVMRSEYHRSPVKI